MTRDGFLDRWSRRKRAAQPGTDTDPRVAEPDPSAKGRQPGEEADSGRAETSPAGTCRALGVLPEGPAPDSVSETGPDGDRVPDPELLASLPDIDSLTPESDLSVFLQKGVPQALKNAAMRRMWALDPVISAHKDIAVDYAWDWNTPGGVPGNGGIISRSSVSKLLEQLRPKPAAEEPHEVTVADASPEPPAADPQPAPPSSRPAPEDAVAADPASAPQVQAVASEVEDESPPRPRRHGRARPA